MNNFCLQPWIGIHAWPDGSVFPCCMYNSKTPLGNLNKEKITDLVNNEYYQKLRLEMIEGKSPLGCQRCYQLESSGVQTLRQSTNQSYGYLTDDIIKEKKLTMSDVKYVDIRFSNICNMKCRTCGPELSSKWGAEMPILKHQPDPGVIQIPKDQFWDFYERALETAEEIIFAGGEALMQEEHYAALNKLIELGKFNVKILYTTNLSTLKYKQTDLFELWSKFNRIEIYASLDAMEERAEYLRKGTEWSKIIENRIKIMQLKKVKFSITPTISLFNVWHFPDFHKNWVDNGLLDIGAVRLNILTWPPRYQANVLKDKKPIIEKWKSHINWIKQVRDDSNLINQFQSVINFLETDHDHDNQQYLIKDFHIVTDKIDEIRNEKLLEVFPELRDQL